MNNNTNVVAVDIDFLVELLKCEALRLSKTEHFYSITKNHGNKNAIDQWDTMYLYNPNHYEGCRLEFFSSEWKQKVSLVDYNRIIEYAPYEERVVTSAEKNQESMLEYIRKKIENYDNNSNRKA